MRFDIPPEVQALASTPVTKWFRITHNGLDFNHIENGHSDSDVPTPKFPSQRGWLNQKWSREHAFLTDDTPPKIIPNKEGYTHGWILQAYNRHR